MSDANEKNAAVIAEFRANAGRVGGEFAGQALLLLHTIGAKSGQTHVTPMYYTRDGEHLVVIATNNGKATNPDWYHNLVANPLVSVEIGSERFQARATVAAEPERTRLFHHVASQTPALIDYQRNIARPLPFIVLKR